MLSRIVLLLGLLALPAVASPAFPLSTSSRWIVDATGKRVKLACANWAGGAQLEFVPGGLDHQTAASIAGAIKGFGFSCVRLPFSVQLVLQNPVVKPARLSANPALAGSTALEVLDAVVSALAEAEVMVVIDNHMSRGDWCCNDKDGNGLWYTDNYTEAEWIKAWAIMASRYKSQPWVIGAELRNEPRCATVGGKYLCATWGGSSATDWRGAAIRGGTAVQAANANLLIIVDGISYATDLTGVYSNPITSFPNKLVYGAHDYSWSQSGQDSESALHTYLGQKWGYIVAEGKPYTAPVWVSEFGTPHDGSQMGSETWWAYFTSYLAGPEGADFDWGYWRVDGTESNGTSRTFGAPAAFGVFGTNWQDPADGGTLLHGLQPLMKATQGPNE